MTSAPNNASQHYTCKSPGCFTAEIAGNKHVLDSADWVFAAMRDTGEHSVLRNLGIKKFSDTFQTEKKNLRGRTMLFVLDSMLNFHCGCAVKNVNTALTIAGYPSNNRKGLKPAKFNISQSSLDSPPVNTETLFARAIVAVDASYKQENNTRRGITIGPVRITLAHGAMWRQDDHLGRYLVAGLFQEQELVVTKAGVDLLKLTTDL
jgi:hypothetical protein